MSQLIDQIRADFPILKRQIGGRPLIYFDNAATSQKPRPVIEAITRYYRRHNANIHRGVHQLADEATQLYEEARSQIAAFFGAQPEELIFVRNTTEAINLVAHHWAPLWLKKGDLILTSIIEHHSNLLPWQQLQERLGIRLELIGLDQDYRLDYQQFLEKLNLKPKLVALNHVSNVLGTINPIRAMVRAAHRAGALVLVDAAQSAPHLAIDFSQLGADFLAFSGHKMLGPMGIGGLLVKKGLLEELPPLLVGGGMVAEVKAKKAKFLSELPTRFEAGTPNVAGAVGLAAAVNYLQKIGLKTIFKHEQKLNRLAHQLLAELPQIKLFPPRFSRYQTGIVSFTFAGIHSHDLAHLLSTNWGIAVRSGHHCAIPLHRYLQTATTTRASFYLYNTEAEVTQLAQALKEISRLI